MLHARVGLLAWRASQFGHAVGWDIEQPLRPRGRATHRPKRGSEAVGHRTLPAPIGCDIAVTSNSHLTDIIMMSYTGHMDIERHVQAIQSDLAAAAALGDEAIGGGGRAPRSRRRRVAPAPSPRRSHGRLARAQRPAPVRPRRGAAGRAQPRSRLRRRPVRPRRRPHRHPATTSAPASPSGSRRRSRSRSRSSRAAKASRPTPGSCVPSSRALEPRRGRTRSGRRLQGYTQS